MPQTKNLPLDLIDGPKLAVRTITDDEDLEDLMTSMRELGLLEPIVVRPVADRYEIIAGHRRDRAARLLNWTHIEAKIIHADEEEVFALRLAENLQRKDIDPVDEACFIGEIMLKYKKTAQDMATLLKRSQKWIDERIEVFEMPKYIQDHLKLRKYPLGAALWIARIENEKTRQYYANYAAINGVTVAAAHRWYVSLKENEFILSNIKEVVEGAGTPQEQRRTVVKCARCGQDLFLDEADSVFIHPICPDQKVQEKG